ncbi:uncharacterized protein LOC128557220 [Mercenaria mercenaria]|uniref:uncharacterized protein LOC128557220 n=1 Tax=Mercenaria mercenaria TaxID=6596 RepID=UPI00234E7654|nr:uncharacterized protein LOC128557220 [Mercenaria mercenaria]XP_053400330.1 uncharacterized protein LOC128557220 [Mercenaria mercenaria]XP_053400331.1 uncharacterized protein LOC128557220 [Mercenaria mercenaria]
MPTSGKTAIPFEGTNPEETNDAYFVQTPNNQGNVSGEESDVSFTADLQSSGEESLEEQGVTRTSRTTLNLEYDNNPSNLQQDTSTCISSAAHALGAAKQTGSSLATTSAAPAFNLTEGGIAGHTLYRNTQKSGTIGGFVSDSDSPIGLFSVANSGLGSTGQTLEGPNINARLNAQNKPSSVREQVSFSARKPVNSGSTQDDNICIISRDESVNDDVIIDERPVTPHTAGGMSAGTSMYGNALNKPGGQGAFSSAAQTEDKFPDKEDEAHSNLTVAKGYKPKEKRPKDHQIDPPSLIKDVMCHVCSVEVSNIVFLPCSHLYCCESCANKEPKCKICRKQVEKKLKVYRN